MKANLEVVTGAKPVCLEIRLPSVIGRSNNAKVKLRGSTVSRQHCELYEYEGQLVVRDLGSSNGTVVNGHRIETPTFLTPDDLLTIGPVTLRATGVETPAHSSQSGLATREKVGKETQAPALARIENPATEFSSGDASANLTHEDAGHVTTSAEGDLLQDDQSVLSYRENPEGSFIEIGNDQGIADIPVFDAEDTRQSPKVKQDDSALNSFFDSLG